MQAAPAGQRPRYGRPQLVRCAVAAPPTVEQTRPALGIGSYGCPSIPSLHSELQREKEAVSKQVQQLKTRMQRAREQDRRALVKITSEVGAQGTTVTCRAAPPPFSSAGTAPTLPFSAA